MAPRRPRLVDAMTYGGYRMASAFARVLPGAVADGIAPSIALGANFASPQRRAMIERHLRRADPTLGGVRLGRAVQAAFDSYTRYWMESFRLPYLGDRVVARGMRATGFEHIVASQERGRGTILALPHLGGWEWGGRWMVQLGYRMTVVVERIDPPELFDWFVDLRRSLGMEVVPLGPSVTSQIVRALRDNHVVCLLCDRDIQRTGVEVDFFGETTTIPAGPATLALRTGADLLPTAVYFTDQTDGHLAVIRPPLDARRGDGGLRADVTDLTGRLVDELEHLIRRAPHQWHLFQANWPSDPGYDR